MTTIKYFSWVRDLVGTGDEFHVVPDTVTDVRGLCQFLAAQSEGHARAFANLDRIRCAIDLNIVDLDAPIAGAGEIAFFPPVTGG